MLKNVHHINFVVRDLDLAISTYEGLFQVRGVQRERLVERGVETARFRLGGIWIVLVEPTDPDSAPGRYLAEHGEGFFLVSYRVDDVEEAARKVRSRGARLLNEESREGLEDWRVIDIDPRDTMGVLTQLVESANG